MPKCVATQKSHKFSNSLILAWANKEHCISRMEPVIPLKFGARLVLIVFIAIAI